MAHQFTSISDNGPGPQGPPAHAPNGASASSSLNTSTPQPLNTSTPQHLNTLTPLRKLLIALVLLLALIALILLSLQLKARLHYHFGGDAMEAKQYAEAVRQYEKAAQGQPRDGRMVKALGEALHALSREKTIQEAFDLERRAANAFGRAARLIPIDAEAHYGLAQSLARLEQMQAMLHPADPNPFHPLPAFQRAIELRPNGILYRYALARHLYRTGEIRAFRNTIQELVRIYPPTYHQLKREPFWSEPLEPVAQQGLAQAVDEGIMPRDALMALADILESQGRPREAAAHYTMAMQQSPRDNTPAHHIRLGRLYLKADEMEKAEESFMQGLTQSVSRESDLGRVLSAFKAQGRAEAFVDFFERADRTIPFSLEARLVTAEAMIQTGAFIEARHLLDRLNRQRPTAQAHFLLYRIAEEQKDLDRMEIAIQKATVLAPRESRYHLLFSRVLIRAGKLDMAERAATRAMETADAPSAGLFHHRAMIRRRLNDFQGALADWKSGMTLAPDKAIYHAQAAEVLLQLARFDEALAHAAKAEALEPQNEQYRKRHAQLREQIKSP